MHSDLRDKIVLITGASRGIGKELALKYMSEGYFVINLSRSTPEYELSRHITCDITDSDNINLAYEIVAEEFNRVDILINNAGIGMYEKWEDAKMSEIRKLFDLNFFGAIEVTQKFLPLLKESKGSIINISSVAGKIYLPFMGAYSASKFALSVFSNSLRAELKEDGVHVLDCIVGRVDTEFSQSVFGSKNSPKTPLIDSPKKLAKKIYSAQIKRKREIIFPKWYAHTISLFKMIPSIYDRESTKKWNRANEQ